MDVGGVPMIQRVIDSVREVSGLYAIALATVPADREDINAELRRYGSGEIPDYMHAYDIADADVLGRFALTAAEYPCDVIMRVTGDCPLWNPRIAEDVLRLYKATDVDYASNIAPGYRDGEDVEVFSRKALMRANAIAHHESDREHVTPWIRRNCKTVTLLSVEDRSDIKTSVDTLEDLERVRAMVTA